MESGTSLLDMHMKDLRDPMDKEGQCIVGEGAMPVVSKNTNELKTRVSRGGFG